jgi:hypothetical protein
VETSGFLAEKARFYWGFQGFSGWKRRRLRLRCNYMKLEGQYVILAHAAQVANFGDPPSLRSYGRQALLRWAIARQARTMIKVILRLKGLHLFTLLKIKHLNVYKSFTNRLQPIQVIEYKRLKCLHLLPLGCFRFFYQGPGRRQLTPIAAGRPSSMSRPDPDASVVERGKYRHD